jgi:hypothetical protein
VSGTPNPRIVSATRRAVAAAYSRDGEAEQDARRFAGRYRGELGTRERAYLEAVLRLADRAVRTRRLAVAGTISLLAGLVVAAAVALVWIRDAERVARREADRARVEERRAREAGEEILTANEQLQVEKDRQAELLGNLQRANAAREAARSEADQAATQVQRGKVDLQAANAQLRAALVRAEAESANARTEAERAKEQERIAAEETLRAEELARKERERADRIERSRGKVSTKLP